MLRMIEYILQLDIEDFYRFLILFIIIATSDSIRVSEANVIN